MKKLLIPALALASAVTLMPSTADAQYYRHRYYRGGGGGAVAAGVAAGLIGGALIAGAASRPVYAAPAPVYVEPAPVVVQRRCWIERRPILDEYDEVVAYRRQRVCG